MLENSIAKKLTSSPAGYSWLKQTQRHTSANLPSRYGYLFNTTTVNFTTDI